MTIQGQKYKAKPVFWDTELRSVLDVNSIGKYRTKDRLKLPNSICRFDSQHEFKVYLELCRMYGTDKIVRQHPLEVIPSGYCYPNGKSWKVDFAVTLSNPSLGFSHYVEAKGAFLPEFAHTLSSLELHNDSVFSRLSIVFTDEIPKTNRMVKALMKTDFKSNLFTLKELEQLKTLP